MFQTDLQYDRMTDRTKQYAPGSLISGHKNFFYQDDCFGKRLIIVPDFVSPAGSAIFPVVFLFLKILLK